MPATVSGEVPLPHGLRGHRPRRQWAIRTGQIGSKRLTLLSSWPGSTSLAIK
jgi:hypothetical protein